MIASNEFSNEQSPTDDAERGPAKPQPKQSEAIRVLTASMAADFDADPLGAAAKVLYNHPEWRAEIVAYLQQHQGNAFVQQVLKRVGARGTAPKLSADDQQELLNGLEGSTPAPGAKAAEPAASTTASPNDRDPEKHSNPENAAPQAQLTEKQKELNAGLDFADVPDKAAKPQLTEKQKALNAGLDFADTPDDAKQAATPTQSQTKVASSAEVATPAVETKELLGPNAAESAKLMGQFEQVNAAPGAAESAKLMQQFEQVNAAPDAAESAKLMTQFENVNAASANGPTAAAPAAEAKQEVAPPAKNEPEPAAQGPAPAPTSAAAKNEEPAPEVAQKGAAPAPEAAGPEAAPKPEDKAAIEKGKEEKPEEKAHGTVRITASALRIRAEPSLNGQILGKIPRGGTAEVVGHEGAWLKIKYGEGTAFIHSKYTTAVKGNESGEEEEQGEQDSQEQKQERPKPVAANGNENEKNERV